MKKLVLAAAMMTFAVAASADTATGTLQVTGTVQSSINLTIESAGGTTSGLTTGAAVSGLGNIAKYSAAPSGYTLTRSGSDWTLTANVGVKVSKANLTSASYNLTAELQSAPPTGVTYTLASQTLSDSSAATVGSNVSYGGTATYALAIVVADSAADETDIANVIDFTATSN